MSVASVRDVKIPSATPLVYSFEARESLSGGAVSIKPMGEPTILGMTGRYIATKEMVRVALEDSIGAEQLRFSVVFPPFEAYLIPMS
jgi:hypothetical protein